MLEPIGTEVEPWSMGDRQLFSPSFVSPALKTTGGYRLIVGRASVCKIIPLPPQRQEDIEWLAIRTHMLCGLIVIA